MVQNWAIGGAMPRYFFHMIDKRQLVDTDGTELADLAEAQSHATIVAKEMMSNRDEVLGRGWSDWTMSVHDNDGKELFSFALADINREKN